MAQQTFNVSENARIEIRHCRERVTLIGWDDAMRVEVSHPARQEGNTIVIEKAERVSARVPHAATVFIAECDADVRVEDLDGRVELAQIDGDVVLRDLRGAVAAHYIDGDLAARAVKSLQATDTWDGDITAREIESFSAEKIDGNLALNQVGAVQAKEVEGDVTISQANGAIAIERVEGDFVISGLRVALDLQQVEGDAVVSVQDIAPLDLRAEGDIVLNLPEGANAELELDAPHGDLIASADIETEDEERTSHLRGKLGSGGVKIHAESIKGDLVLRVGGAQHAHMRGRVHIDSREFAEMGPHIAREVRTSVRDSIRGSVRESVREMRRSFGFRHQRHDHGHHRTESRVEEKPRGPTAGTPERQAILDAIARGELNVEDAIKKLRGEE